MQKKVLKNAKKCENGSRPGPQGCLSHFYTSPAVLHQKGLSSHKKAEKPFQEPSIFLTQAFVVPRSTHNRFLAVQLFYI